MQRHKYFETVERRLTPPCLSPAEHDRVASCYETDPTEKQAQACADVFIEERKTLPPTVGIHIAGRRWFQRSAGNTYHAVTVHLPGGETIESGRTYGYGEQYLDTAWELLEARGLVQGKHGGTRVLRERYGITYSVADVARERDL